MNSHCYSNQREDLSYRVPRLVYDLLESLSFSLAGSADEPVEHISDGRWCHLGVIKKTFDLKVPYASWLSLLAMAASIRLSLRNAGVNAVR